MFEEGKFYTHSKMLDSKIWVQGYEYVDQIDSHNFRVKWFTKTGLWLGDDLIWIRPEDLGEWTLC